MKNGGIKPSLAPTSNLPGPFGPGTGTSPLESTSALGTAGVKHSENIHKNKMEKPSRSISPNKRPATPEGGRGKSIDEQG